MPQPEDVCLPVMVSMNGVVCTCLLRGGCLYTSQMCSFVLIHDVRDS